MAWLGKLAVDYALRDGPDGSPRTVALARHEGPLRVMRSLYPEGPVCHSVMVHPPACLTGGDTLEVRLCLEPGTHAVLTTPGATRFHRSTGEPATQAVHAHLGCGARLEWLPLENVAYDGCLAHNRACFELASGAELMAWDITALGLPASGLHFTQGFMHQRLELTGAWLDSGRIAAKDHALLDGPLGLHGRRCLATLIFACGEAITRARREMLQDAARACIHVHELQATAAATSPHPRVLALRVLAHQVEPALGLLRQVHAAWRALAWQLEGAALRSWLDERAG